MKRMMMLRVDKVLISWLRNNGVKNDDGMLHLKHTKTYGFPETPAFSSFKKRPAVSFHATAKPAFVATAAARPFSGNAKLCDRFTKTDSPLALQVRSIFWLQIESPFCQTIWRSTSLVGMTDRSDIRRGRLTEQSPKEIANNFARQRNGNRRKVSHSMAKHHGEKPFSKANKTKKGKVC